MRIEPASNGKKMPKAAYIVAIAFPLGLIALAAGLMGLLAWMGL